MLDNVARIRYIQRCLVDSFRNNLGKEDVNTSRNGIKFGSGEPQFQSELIVLRLKENYHGLQIDESLAFISSSVATL